MNVMANPSLRSVNPAASTLANGWFRDGCIAEPASGRLFTGAALTSDNMTPALCVAFCSNISQNKKGNFSYAGTEYGRECYCSATLPASATPRADDAKCSMTCAAAPSLPCGGPAYMSLYSLHTDWKVAALNNTALPVSWKPVGCFAIGAAAAVAQLTTAPFFSDSAMTNSMCASRCATYKSSYAVTQFGTQCFCGDANSIALDTVASKMLDPTMCDITCGGSVLERCGGVSTSSVMLTGQPGAGAPSASSATGSGGAAAAVEASATLRIRLNVALASVTYSFLSTLRDIIANFLSIDSYRVAVEVDSSSSDSGSATAAGRRLLQYASSSNSTYLLVTLSPDTSSGTEVQTVAALKSTFMDAFPNTTSTLSKQLLAQGVDSTYTPQEVRADGASSSTGAGTPSSVAASHSSSSGAPAGAIAGAVIGAVLLVLVVIASVMLIRRRQAAKASMNKMQTNSGSQMGETYKI